ncbi:elongator complex protein 4 [Trichonephila clavipes]|uniref:Elongator complex protein 4 n=1 Tax=Trichonephila clavipes TaxID=2585209 RepID=A0A8X6RHA4_TRICX|nr:elongator complex protein 4 [Trichonephila clavipes]
MIIFGDFNLHHLMWGLDHISRYSNECVEWITDSNLVLLNMTVPTYRSSAGAASLIDLTVCSSSMSGYCNSYVLDCSFESDHSPIITELSLNSNKRIFIKRKIEELKELLFGLETANPTEEAEFEEDLYKCETRLDDLESGIKAYSHNHGFDLSKTISEELLQSCSITTWDPSEKCPDYFGIDQNFITFPMSYLLQRISSEITYNGFRTSSKGCDNIMRIAVTSLGSPLWHSGSEKNQELDIIRFLYLLKALLRTSYAVAVVTVPSYIVQDKILISRIRQICDIVISLECFVGSGKKSNPLFKEYNGLIQIVKLPVLNTFIYPIQMTDLAFKLKRKDFVIERLHLPPDFEEAQGDAGSFGCSGKPSKLDF